MTVEEKIISHIEQNCTYPDGSPMMDEQTFYEGAKWGYNEAMRCQSSPKIKQVEWDFHGLYYLAQTPFGAYILEENEENENMCDLYFGNLLLRNNIPVSEAKSAAQADFEKRIKECLIIE